MQPKKNRQAGNCELWETSCRWFSEFSWWCPQQQLSFLNRSLEHCSRFLCAYGIVQSLLCRLEPLHKASNLAVQAFGKVTAELGEVLLDQRRLGQPTLDVDAE